MEPIPAFPSGFSIYPACKISLAQLIAEDGDEIANMFQACARDGFFMLDLSDAPDSKSTLQAIGIAFDVSKKYFQQTLEEKLAYKMDERAMGYKPVGVLKSKRKADSGKGDFMEIFSINTTRVRNLEDNNLPQLMLDHRKQLIEVTDGLQAVGAQLFAAMSKALHVSPTLLQNAHDPKSLSSTALRFLFSPGQPETGNNTEQRSFSLPGHQDHGSLALLFNVLGGLQVLRPGANEDDGDDAWLWIKPEVGCAIVILGNPFVEWTGGVWRSAFHRVLHPPGQQAILDRYSFGLFIKPSDTCLVKRFDGSDIIPQDQASHTTAKKTYGDWHAGSIASYNKSVSAGS